MRILLASLLFLFCFFEMKGQQFISFEEIKYNNEIKFPFAVSTDRNSQKIATRLNKPLQNIIFYDEDIINNENINKLTKHLFIRNDSIDQSGISYLDYKIEQSQNFLRITVDIDWAGRPYPVGAESEQLHFDLMTGEYITFPDLIETSKYFEFLDQFWLETCNNSIRESHQCAHGNETDNYESTETFKLEGKCEFQCHKINYKFVLGLDSVLLGNNTNCFPMLGEIATTAALNTSK
ncbi:MAG: hypothetical protein AAGI25_21015 [Bacteroidota bacterium]